MIEAPKDPDEATRQALAQNVRWEREARGWSQMDLAKRSIFVGQATVSAIERGVHSATTHTISHLAAALQVTPWMLLVPPRNERPTVADMPNDSFSDASMHYIRQHYVVPAVVGARVRYQPPEHASQFGEIVGACGPYLRVRYEGVPGTAVHHPTWCLHDLSEECQP
jgi:transcriptional regulator with XRE-family HTH domain